MMTVSENIFHELDFFAVSFALGILLVLVYDCLRIFRRLVRHGVVWISLEDLCYWIFTAFVVFAMLYQKRRRDPRVFHWGNPAWYAAVQPLNQPLYGKVHCARFKESDSSDTQNMEDTDSAFSKGCVKSFE